MDGRSCSWTNVITGYLRGEPSPAQLFSEQAQGRVRFAVNPIVLQELLLSAETADRPGLEQILDQLRVLPIDLAKAEALVPEYGPHQTACHTPTIF